MIFRSNLNIATSKEFNENKEINSFDKHSKEKEKNIGIPINNLSAVKDYQCSSNNTLIVSNENLNTKEL